MRERRGWLCYVPDWIILIRWTTFRKTCRWTKKPEVICVPDSGSYPPDVPDVPEIRPP